MQGGRSASKIQHVYVLQQLATAATQGQPYCVFTQLETALTRVTKGPLQATKGMQQVA